MEEKLKREIGVWGLTANIINIMIGAGIFVLPAIVAAGLGSASILAYLFCGTLVGLVMLCFAEVGTKITSSGGPYAYIEGAFGEYFGFLTSILFLLSNICADAAIANALADMLSSMIPVLQHHIAKLLFFLILFSGLAYVNVVGVKESMVLVKTITIAKLTPLVLLIVVGLPGISTEQILWKTSPSLNAIGEMSLVLFFAFLGAESGLAVSGEVKNSQRTVPRAILISILGVLTIYILIQIISQGILGDSLPSFRENPLGEVARIIFGPIGLTLITIGAGVSMFGNLSSEMLSLPRVLYGAASKNVIPFKALSVVHKKYATPFVAIIVYAILGFVFASAGGFKQLAVIASATLLLIYFGVSLAAIKLRIDAKKEESSSTFKIPGGYVIPIAAALAIVWFLSHLKQNEVVAIVGFIATLSVIYLLKHRLTKVPK
jgi:APA family basic amino acid/polyamine antiporter